jgi:hypothetical protein
MISILVPSIVQYAGLHPILMSILLYHYIQLTECTSGVEQIEARGDTKRLTKKEKSKASSQFITKLIKQHIDKV